MAQVERDRFEGIKLAPVFLAISLAEALKAEGVLSAGGVDYVVEIEKCWPGFLRSPAAGAVFYVLPQQVQYCRERLLGAGLAGGVVNEPDL
ncbi:MAG: hypothetical protein AB1714_29805 [Acidobacteriota bacterium]